jgi:hypothetical protein
MSNDEVRVGDKLWGMDESGHRLLVQLAADALETDLYWFDNADFEGARAAATTDGRYVLIPARQEDGVLPTPRIFRDHVALAKSIEDPCYVTWWFAFDLWRRRRAWNGSQQPRHSPDCICNSPQAPPLAAAAGILAEIAATCFARVPEGSLPNWTFTPEHPVLHALYDNNDCWFIFGNEHIRGGMSPGEGKIWKGQVTGNVEAAAIARYGGTSGGSWGAVFLPPRSSAAASNPALRSVAAA